MKMVNYEIRDSKLHLSGYVNAVERDSRVIVTKRGKCVEQIAKGAFAASIADGHEVRMKLNHKRDIGSTADGTITLSENSIGLYAEAVTDDEELMTLAAKGELRGWSFGFVAKADEMEERSGKEPRRRVKALDLQEVSILSVTPAYEGTSVEVRSYEQYTDEVMAYKDDEGNVTEAIVTHSESDNDGSVTTTEYTDRNGTATDTVVRSHSYKEDVQALRRVVEKLRLKGYIHEKRAEQRELEERYNHYHDPRNGQFASGAGGGMGLYYSMGKGKGAVVGASSPLKTANKPLDSTKIAQANARGSMFYSAGDALNRSYNRDIDDIEKMDGLTSEEKAEAKAKVHALASKELDAKAKYIDPYTAGTARDTNTRKHLEKATDISSMRESYMKELKRKSDKVKTAREKKQVTDAIMAATERGETSVTINGKKYVRKSKRSGTWQQALL